jgi:hypothetical protein
MDSSPADAAKRPGWRAAEPFVRRTVVFQGDGHFVIHDLPEMPASEFHASGTFSNVHLI